MIKVAGVRFKESGKIYYFDPQEFPVEEGVAVIVETARGVEFGTVAVGVKEVEEQEVNGELKPILRIADDSDHFIHRANLKKAQEAMHICKAQIEEHHLDMKLVDCEFTFDCNKVIFYFIADQRIDFRELVKNLAYIFKVRIELRQIGVRDQAKQLGGLGSCGQPCCCKRFLTDFDPVSIKMAKDQNLSLNPTKISGLCGRLMCCLRYEQEGYEEKLKKMPHMMSYVETPDGEGQIIETNTLLEKVKVRVKQADGTEQIGIYSVEEITGIDRD